MVGEEEAESEVSAAPTLPAPAGSSLAETPGPPAPQVLPALKQTTENSSSDLYKCDTQLAYRLMPSLLFTVCLLVSLFGDLFTVCLPVFVCLLVSLFVDLFNVW